MGVVGRRAAAVSFRLPAIGLALVVAICGGTIQTSHGQLLGSVKEFEARLEKEVLREGAPTNSQMNSTKLKPTQNPIPEETGIKKTAPSAAPSAGSSTGASTGQKAVPGSIEPLTGWELCWSSSSNGGGYPSTSNPQVGAVTFYSSTGCSRCRVGEICNVHLVVLPPAHWAHNASVRLWELIATLRGPSLVLARVQHLPPMDGSAFLISYQPWDAGLFRLVVLSSCGMLQFRDNFTIGEEEELASWDVQVEPSEASLNLPNSKPARVDYRPCLINGVQARWVRSADGNYTWQPFPCSTTYPANTWIAELNKRGIKEINFIGDSHHKRTGLHIYYLMTGQTNEPAQWFQVGDKVVANDSRGGFLKINTYFVHGVYASNDQYNCSMRFRKTPEPEVHPISRTADVNILEAGYWTSYACEHPEFSFARHFPDYLWWLQKATVASQNVTNLGAHGRMPRIVCRASPPVPTMKYHCQSHSNVVLQAENTLARDLCPVAQGLFFDSWEIEAPRHHETCPRDHHYTCLHKGEQRVSGPIGEAVSHSLVHFLLRNMKPL